MRLGAGNQHIYSAVNLSSSVVIQDTWHYALVYNDLALLISVCEKNTRKGGNIISSYVREGCLPPWHVKTRINLTYVKKKIELFPLKKKSLPMIFCRTERQN